MFVAQSVGVLDTLLVVLYLAVIGYLGWLGYRRTRGAADYLIAGRQVHPFIMAVSYGATFISTSAIVGFGGVAAMFGMSLLWLVFANIFIGVFLAFVVLGPVTRRMGHRLDAHTFPELLGRRYQSKAVQVFAGLVIFLFIPLYAAAVLIGGCEFIAARFGVPYPAALLIFSAIVASYVVVGGLKGVMYTDALQGAIMFVGMAVLLVWTYSELGGVAVAHERLGDMADEAFVGFRAIGHEGWTAMPAFGWGDTKHDLWWIVISTITLGVGIGVLAQPQLVVRFMTVRSRRQLNRAVLVGGVFILMMVGVVYVVGALSNVYFARHEQITGHLVGPHEPTRIILKKERGVLKRVDCQLLHIDVDGDQLADVHVIRQGLGKAEAILPKADVTTLANGRVEVRPRATSFVRAVVHTKDGWALNADSIVPLYITQSLPAWFGVVFLLTLLAAAMSTASSQFHALGASIARDVWLPLTGKDGRAMAVTRIGILIGITIAVLFAYYARGGYFIARATAIFFGLCASTFLPAFVGGLFCKWVTRAGCIASMVIGFTVSAGWLTLVKAKEAGAIGIVQELTGGKPSLLADYPNWPVVDPVVIALPLSVFTLVLVSMVTRKPSAEHLALLWPPRR